MIPKGWTVLEENDTLLLFGDRAKLSSIEAQLARKAEHEN